MHCELCRIESIFGLLRKMQENRTARVSAAGTSAKEDGDFYEGEMSERKAVLKVKINS